MNEALYQRTGEERPTKPEPFPCQHCGRRGRVYFSARKSSKGYSHWAKDVVGYWVRNRICSRCQMGLLQHGMTGPQMDVYLADGCSVKGCVNTARYIDHDHLIHSQASHSCEKCRRGPLCPNHNTNVMRMLDNIRSGTEMFENEWEYANRLHSVSVVLAGEADSF